MSSRFYIFVSDLNQGNKEVVWILIKGEKGMVEDFLGCPPGIQRLSEAVENIVGCESVWSL